MRILLIHPEDSLDTGPWFDQEWHQIVDLGQGSQTSYRLIGERQRCPVASLNSFSCESDGYSKIRELLAAGIGVLTDDCGLDWWELTSLMLHRQLELIALLQRFVDTLNADDEVHISRADFHASALQYLLPGRLSILSRHRTQGRGMGHYFRVWKRFPFHQLAEIFWDKTDPGYQFRGRFTRQRQPSQHPVVLLPTAYGNASRTAISYARTAPDLNFLLVATRPSGRLNDLPANVAPAWLCSYAALDSSRREIELKGLLERWQSLRGKLEERPEFAILSRAGSFDDLPRCFRQGLEIRDAWRNVLDQEPAQAVLCTDDSNPYTHIPLLLARDRGLPTVACHHGALDGRYLFKRPHADVILAKGRMEADYLVRRCGVSRSKVEVGAPGELPQSSRQTPWRCPFIVFFSEAYEVSLGRAGEFYREILPPLAEVARSTGRQLIVKLHPFESMTDRQELLARVLSEDDQCVVRLVSGPLTNDLLSQTWCGVTVLSTVTMECALRGIPCFMASWLEHWPYSYVDQFSKFGVGYALRSAEELAAIPKIMERYAVPVDAASQVWSPISALRLERLLSAGKWVEQEAAV